MQDFAFDTTMSIDLDEVKEFVNNDLAGLLLENTTNFGVAAFCLQAVMNEIERVEGENE